MRVPAVDRGAAAAAGAGAGSGGKPPGLAGFPWERAAALGRFVLADGSAAAAQPTVVRVACDPRALYVRFECADRDAWGTYRHRNDPIYQEEAVEVFLAPGEAAPRRYWEIEVSPLGVLFAARVDNPTGRRSDLVADTTWECRGIEWQAGPAGTSQDWWAELAIPWAAMAGGAGSGSEPAPPGAEPPGSEPPRRWRANFYRIERPRGGRPELSCWSPTFTDPPDFHRPERFGILELEPSGAGPLRQSSAPP
ncbi:MAG: carbohydrate-binding family 9-like protein [Acidobacteria bacterium]|nr:carbohydrate-binding family 9-like protein [Acidobacteriota bacterium]